MNIKENLTATWYFPEKWVYRYYQPIVHFTYWEDYEKYKAKHIAYEKQLSKVQKSTKTNNTKLLHETKG